MTLLTKTSGVFDRCATGAQAASPHMNAIVSASSQTGIALALSLLLFAGRTCPAQQRAALSPANLQQAETLIQQGRLHEAKSLAQDELKRNPSSVEALNLLGIIEADQHDFTSAQAAFQQALKLAPSSTKTRNNLGNVYVAQQKLDLAEKEFRAGLKLDPGNRDGNYNLGLLLMAKGAPAEAIPHLERVRPQNTETRFNLIRAYLHASRAPDALRLATELSEQSGNSVQVHFSLGILLASEKQYGAAKLELEKADALQPETFEILYNLGQDLLRNTDYAKAELALTRALKLKPESAETMYLLAQSMMNQSRPLDALDLLLRARKIAPQNADVIFLMALVSMSQNYYEDAIPLLEAGIQIAPRRTDLLAALGESYFMSGKADKAVEAFKKLVAMEKSARAYGFLGLSFRNLGRFDEAKQYFLQGIKIDPKNASCLFNLGFIAERQGDAAEAEARFQETLRFNPDFPDAMLELANLRIAAGKRAEAVDLLRKYVKLSKDPATGYYKLAMVERALHQSEAAERDLAVFKTLSKDASAGPLPYQHLFDYLDTRSRLPAGARDQLDLADLSEQIGKHPDQPENLYMLAQTYLKAGKLDDARNTIAQLDKLSTGDYRALTGTGVLLARFRLYDEAIRHFQAALKANADSDEVKFDLANAYFRKRSYAEALDTANQVSAEGQKDEAYLALLGDIYSHLGQADRAAEIFRSAISRNPDNDQDYLSLALLQLRGNQLEEAKQTLLKGQTRIPGSGKLYWGLGLISALDGKSPQAAEQLERAVDLIPEWAGAYSTLGVFYFESGQIAKAKEVLGRFKTSSASGSLDIGKLEQVLEQTPETSATGNEPLAAANRAQLLQLALSLADRTL